MDKYFEKVKHKEIKALKDAVEELNNMEPGDNEGLHSRADDILCEYLTAIGAKELVNAYEKAGDRIFFWYA